MKFRLNGVMAALGLTAAICMTPSASAVRMKPYNGYRVFWDSSTETSIFRSAGYPRMIELQDGRLMACAESAGIVIAFSSNQGRTWSAPVKIAFQPDRVGYCVPDLIQLADGTIIVGFNPRPSEPYSEDRHFGILAVRSTDNGETWSDPIMIFDALHFAQQGCWEPSFLELPSGELQCYFANERDFPHSLEQCISMSRSFDGGLTWSEAERVSFRAGCRDGMPVPILLKDPDEIVVIIEDNGWSGRGMMTTTVRCPLEVNWHDYWIDANNPDRELIWETRPVAEHISGAPYLRQSPEGFTAACYQGNEGRGTDDGDYVEMFVEIGDDRARNFKGRSRPFAVDLNQHALWNSLAFLSDGTLCALGSIGNIGVPTDVKFVKGYCKNLIEAEYSHIDIDGRRGGEEQWVNKAADQIVMGNVIKKRSTFDFAYDEDCLYFTATVIERDLVNDGINNDGVRLLIDAHDICGSIPDVGMFNFFFNTDGRVEGKFARRGGWRTVEATELSGIEYSLDIKKMYYTIEAAIPWSLLGHDSAPVAERMAVGLEIFNNDGNGGYATEGISDLVTNKSWTWMEFRLRPSEADGVTEIAADGKGMAPEVALCRDAGILTVESDRVITSLDIYDMLGRRVCHQGVSASTVSCDYPAAQRGIAMVCHEDGTVATMKF